MKENTFEIFVLAGGKSSRMGTDKGLMHFRSKPLIQHMLNTLHTLYLPVSLIANNGEYHRFGLPVYTDIIKEKGPMGGLLTAMHYTKADAVLLLSCDMPFIEAAAVHQLLNGCRQHHDITAATAGQRIYPLLAVYKKTLLPEVMKSIESGNLKMTEFIRSHQHTFCGMDALLINHPWMLDNFNSPDDIKKHNGNPTGNHREILRHAG